LLFDFDGDGEPEALVVVETQDIRESGLSSNMTRGRVWSWRGGKVELYPPARDFAVERIEDFDGDGRPDLVTRGPYAELATVTCGSEESYPVYGPAVVLHSLRGGRFDSSDGPALAAAKVECPRAPNPVLVAAKDRAGFIDFAASARNVACSRLWGGDEQHITAEIRGKCRKLGACLACDDQDMLERWARVPPPLRLDLPTTMPRP
jgi:hypothetical protein